MKGIIEDRSLDRADARPLAQQVIAQRTFAAPATEPTLGPLAQQVIA
jgi:hypothetical protein